MKNLVTTLILAVALLTSLSLRGQEYTTLPITVSDGMPGELNEVIVPSNFGGYTIIEQYTWNSPTYSLATGINGVRLTFLDSNYSQLYNGFHMVALSELHFYDVAGYEISYIADDVTYNSLEGSEGSIDALYDNDPATYYHSAWKYAIESNEEPVYLDITFPRPISAFSFSYRTRNTAIAPLSIAISVTGSDYTESKPDSGNTDEGENNNDNTENIQPEAIDIFSEPCLFVNLRDGGIDAYPLSSIEGDYYTQGNSLMIPLASGEEVEYTEDSYKTFSTEIPELPQMTSYKFNNKYNPNLNIDVIADSITPVINLDLNAIGKSLTASFQLSDEKAIAYIGNELQISKESRRRFDKPMKYTVTYPGYNVIANVKVKDEIWDYGEEKIEQINITKEMLYTNKPSTTGDELENMLDGNPATIFHTVYGAAYDATVMPYFTVALDSPVKDIQIYYMTRNTGDYNPMNIKIYASEDGNTWNFIKELTSLNDGLPLSPAGAEYTSPTIELGKAYTHIKLEQTASEYHNNHMVLAEFKMYKVEKGSGETVKIQDAEYQNIKIPFGNIYTVNTNWLTDNGQVPRIDIDIDNGLFVTSKNYYLNANFKITGYGVFDDFEDSVQIKGRGNTTWGYSKKPYRLKFAEKVKPFGLTKGKSWVLLANAQRGALMANAIAMKAGQLIGTKYTNHIIPVELYMNGEYMGNYMFTEKVGIANNSVDIDEDLGYLLELDDYYDETYKFKSSNYNLPVNIKEPDLTEYADSVAQEKFDAIQNDFNSFESKLYSGGAFSIENYIDVDAFARFMLTNDIVLNQELCHPKSTYLWKEDLSSTNSKIIFGPLWDFDWAFGYESTAAYCYAPATSSVFKSSMSEKAGYKFFSDMRSNNTVKQHYYNVWKEFIEKKHIQELIEYLDDYYEFAHKSFEHNYEIWYDGWGYNSDVDRMQVWLTDRINHLDDNIDRFDITSFLYPLLGDVDCNNVLTVRDIALVTNNIAGNEHADFNKDKADVKKDYLITARDAEAIASQVLAAESVSSLYYYNTPMTDALLATTPIEVTVEQNTTLPVGLENFGNEQYNTLQADIKIPLGINLVDITAGESLATHEFSYNQISEDTYRVVIYSNENKPFIESENLFGIELYPYELTPEDERCIVIENILAINTEEVTEVRMDNMKTEFAYSTGIITANDATISLRGGDNLTITTSSATTITIHAIDGRLIQTLRIDEGSTQIGLPAGIYIVNGKKILIR